MPTANSMAELQAMLQKQLSKAMNVAAKKMDADVRESVSMFYAGGEPKVYERTGALGDTPEVTPVSSGGNTSTFDVYLNQSGGYSTGVNPSMSEVLDLTNYGASGHLRSAVGSQGYWEKAEEKFQQTLDSTMSQFFK